MSKLIDRIGNFTAVPNSVIKLWPAIGVDGIALFLYLRYRTNSETEVSFPSYDTIQKDTLITRQRIAKAIRALEAAGVMERKRRFSSSTLYTLKTPISPPVALMDGSPLVQHPNSISPPVALPLVHLSHANKTDLNKKESNKKGLGADKPHREPTDEQKELAHLETLFCELTGHSAPARKTDKERKAAAEMWWQPLRHIRDQANGQSDKALKLAVQKMRADNLTIYSPKSVEKTAIALLAELPKTFRSAAPADPYASLRKYMHEKNK